MLNQTPPLPCAALLVACLVGCGPSDRLPTYQATGRVVFPNGQPLAGGTIIFESRNHPVTARSVIEADGTFALGTYEEQDGAVAGLHRVAISPPASLEYDRDERRAPPLVHPKYLHPDTSELEFSVDPDGTNDFTVVIQRP